MRALSTDNGSPVVPACVYSYASAALFSLFVNGRGRIRENGRALSRLQIYIFLPEHANSPNSVSRPGATKLAAYLLLLEAGRSIFAINSGHRRNSDSIRLPSPGDVG